MRTTAEYLLPFGGIRVKKMYTFNLLQFQFFRTIHNFLPFRLAFPFQFMGHEQEQTKIFRKLF